MLGVRVNSFSENNLGEPEQDANSALTELDKGLRSGRVGEQCEAIVRFPRLFEKYPFPILINSSLLKLAEVFRVGNNFLRLWVLRVCQQSEKHLDKILNVDEFVRRIYSVIHSNDPVARALTLRTLGSVAGIIPERQQVHHSIRRSLDSHDTVEVEAAIYAARQFAAQSKLFAVSMCNKISDMIRGLATPAHMKLLLIPILQYMHHDSSTAAMVRKLCTELLPSYPAQEFVLVTLKSLTCLSSATLVDIPDQVSLLLKYLRNDSRWEVKAQVLKCLHHLAGHGAHLWPEGAVEAIVDVAMKTSFRMLSWSLDVLLVLVTSASTCHSQAHENSPVMKLCRESCYSYNRVIAAKSVKVMTSIVCYSFKEGLPVSCLDQLVDTVESQVVVITTKYHKNFEKELKVCLQCSVSLCEMNQDLCPNFVRLIGSQLMATSGTCSVLLCEALGGIGGLRAGALLSLLPEILKKLKELCVYKTPIREHTHTKVMLCTLVFQTMSDHEWTPDVKNVLQNTIKNTDLWATYRIARSAARYGHHAISYEILCQLKEQVSSEHLHFWLVSLENLSKGEAELLTNGLHRSTLVHRLNTAVSHYSKAVGALKAASTPAQTLQFQSEYTRLRGEFLQCLAQLVHTCHSLCTAPPPAVAQSLAESSRDQLQRYGHIANQLRKCVKEFRGCADMYWKLYQSAFDADPASLTNIQLLQQMCLLMAQSIERVVHPGYQESAILDFSCQSSSLETQYLIKSCQEASSIALQLNRTDEKTITHQLIDCLLREVEILAETSLCVPRYFFQVLQSTSVKLAISPQPRVLGEAISVQSGSQLAVKVEGVIQHGKRPGLFRKVSGVVITVTSQLQLRQMHNSHDPKSIGDGGSVLTQTVPPHRDFFSAQFLLAFPAGGQYLIIVEAAVIDEKGNTWRTGPRNTLTVKSHEESNKGSSSSSSVTAGGSASNTTGSGRNAYSSRF